jgi:NitT/TauT family transport system substrate-binding protein
MLATSASAETAIKIGYTALGDNMIDFVAIDKGFFKKHGIDAKAVMLRNASVIVPGIISGDIQMGTVTSPSFVQALDSGLTLRAVNNLSLTSKGDKTAGLVVPENSKITKPSDLSGKVLGVGAIGSFITVGTREWLRQIGVDTSKTKMIETPMPQLGDTVRNGNVDYTVLPEPLLAKALANGGLHQIVNPFAELPEGKAIMINVVSSDWAKANPEAVAAVRKATEEAKAWALDNKKESMEIVAKYLEIPPAVVAQSSFPNIEVKITPESVDWWVDVMKAQNMLRGNPKPSEAVLK